MFFRLGKVTHREVGFVTKADLNEFLILEKCRGLLCVFNGPFKMISFKMSFSTKQTKIFVNSGFSTGSTTAV